MLFTHTLLFFAAISGLACGYEVDVDLARGLVHNDSILMGLKSNGGRHLSDYPEDCAAVYLNAKALNQHVSSGIYEIWPREGIFVCYFSLHYVFYIVCIIL